MHLRRRLTLALSVAIAAPWSLSLSVAGLWLLTTRSIPWPSGVAITAFAGVTLLAAGQLVFLVFVADRLFPSAGKRVGPWLEAPISLVVIVGSLGLLALLVARLWMGPMP